MRYWNLACVLLCALMLSGITYATAPVHGWRGDGTGRFPEATPVTAWNVERGINVLWRVPLRQFSNAQPIIVGDRVFTMAEGRTIICLDKMTGKLLWINTGADKPITDTAVMQTVVERRLLPGTLEPSESEWTFILDKAIPVGNEVRPLTITVSLHAGKGMTATGSAATYNKAVHTVVADGLSYRDGALTGIVKVTLNPDTYVPADKKPVPAEYNIDATIKEGVVAGTFTGTCGGEAVMGKVANGPTYVPWSERALSYGQYSGSSIPTPTTDGKHIWTKSGGGAACFDLDGNRLWSADTHLAGTDHPINVPSPLLIGNVLVCEGGSTPYWMENSKNKQPEGTFPPNPNKNFKHWLVGLNADTGQLLWDIGPLSAGGYGGPQSPVALTLTDGKDTASFVLTGEGHLVRSSDGKLMIPYAGGRSGFASPVVLPGQRALFGTRAMVQFTLKGPDKVEATILWTAPAHEGAGGAVVHDGVIYSINADKTVIIHAIEEATGKYLSGTVLPITPPGDNADWPCCAVAGKYLFMLAVRQVYVVEPGPTPRLLAANNTDRTHSGPIFDGERLYLRSYNALRCITLKGEEGAQYEREVQARTLLLPFPATLVRRALIEAQPLPKAEKPGVGVPIVKFEVDKMPASWLIAGPFPGVEPGVPATLIDPLARPARGTNVTEGYTTKAFATPERGIVAATGLNALKATADTRGVHLWAYTLLDVDADGYFQFSANQHGVEAWLGGQALTAESVVKLVAGRYALLLKVPVTADTPTAVKVTFHETVKPEVAQVRDLACVRDGAAVLRRGIDLLP
ncbi:MAG: PQQ-binding-like beta-propeller repeat protein, partial [bacterium]